MENNIDQKFIDALKAEDIAFIEEHIEEIDLSSMDYISETDNEDIINLLCEHGAEISWEVCADKYRFSIELVNGAILSLDSDLQEEAYRKFLEISGLTEQDLFDKLEDGVNYVSEDILNFELEDDEDYDRVYNGMTLLEYCKGIGFYVEDGEIVFHDFEYLENDNQFESKEVFEALGWNIREIGCPTEVAFISD